MEIAKTRITSVKTITEPLTDNADCLVEIYGTNIGRKVDLPNSAVTLGRDPENLIVIDTDSVSRHHARIDYQQGSRVLVDLESTNGTYVNDSITQRYMLRTSDLLKIGDTIFKYLSGSDIESAYHEEIYRMTIEDGLTQIPNKRSFDDFLEVEFSRARRYGRDLALIMMDIDHFKSINDQFGHMTGDFVLKELASTIRPRIRREELLARYGGEEFVIVLPETNRDGASQFAEIVRKLIAEHLFEFESNQIPVTISLGIAVLNEQMQRPADLVRSADEKLYIAKRQGRNAVVA